MQSEFKPVGEYRIRSRHRLAACAGVMSLLFFLVVTVGHAASAEDKSMVEFKRAYESAMANAKGSDSLDPAYELLGIAGNARERNLADITTETATAFTDLVQRATAAALRKGGSLAQDTVDQLVDLRFFAETTQIAKTISAIDGALRQLFPIVAKAIEHHLDSAPNWEEKLAAFRDLTSLEASATQVLLPDVAAPIAVAFDTHMATLEAKANAEADATDRASHLSDLAELKRSRREQVNDASTNNVSAVAKQMQSSGRTAGTEQVMRSEADSDLPDNLTEGEGSCIETGYHTAGSADQLHRTHDRDCVNSGRVPIKGRCSSSNLSLICYGRTQDGETMTYVYSGTPAETYFRKACAESDRLPADKIPKGGASFRDAETKLAFVCAPAGSDTAGD